MVVHSYWSSGYLVEDHDGDKMAGEKNREIKLWIKLSHRVNTVTSLSYGRT